MWSHYADNHKGMAILYEFPEKYLNDGKKFIGNPNVSYEHNALTNWFKKWAEEQPMYNYRDFGIAILKKLMTTKSPDWEYEEEVRIIRAHPGKLEIDKKFIKQICFGLQTPDDDITLVREIVSRYDHEVTLCQTRKNKQDFGMSAHEIFLKDGKIVQPSGR